MTLLVDYCRAQGVAMGSVFVGRHIGFTTDVKKVNACREAGAQADQCYNAIGPKGWEIHFMVGRELPEQFSEAVSPSGVGTASVA